MSEESTIWPPHEAFYIECMLTITRTAMADLAHLQYLLQELDADRPINDYQIIDHVQNLVSGAGAISRYFWPSDRADIHQNRAKALRWAFAIKDDNPLKDRKVRNFVEHFDENLDDYLAKMPTGMFVPSYIGGRPAEQQVKTSLFRAYYVDEHVFCVLDHEYVMQPIIKELHGLHQLLLQSGEDGGRLPR